MSFGKWIAVWGERLLAIAVALVTWAILYPNLGTLKRLPDGRQEFNPGNPLALAVYTTILIALVAMIMVGQQRWRILRVVGWVLLLAFLALKCLPVL